MSLLQKTKGYLRRRTISQEEKAARKALILIENDASPEEFCALMTHHPDEFMRKLAHNSVGGKLFDTVDTPQPYKREQISPGVTFYRGSSGASRCMVVFTGFQHRPMLPMPIFLQFIDAADWHVLALTDYSLLQYRTGVEGYAGNMPELARRIRGELDPGTRVLAVGTSMGGMAAIRFYLAGGAERAVSVCGRFPKDGSTLMAGRRPGQAFDPICACQDRRGRPVLFVYGTENDRDRNEAQMAAGLLGGSTLEVQGASEHGVFAKLLREDRFSSIMAPIMDEETYTASRHITI